MVKLWNNFALDPAEALFWQAAKNESAIASGPNDNDFVVAHLARQYTGPALIDARAAGASFKNGCEIRIQRKDDKVYQLSA